MRVAKIRMEKNVGGSPSSVMDKGQRWLKNLRARTTRFHKETACSVKKKMFNINENIKMNKAIKAYQIFTFSKKHTEMFMMKKP
jgi:hypothetical protein